MWSYFHIVIYWISNIIESVNCLMFMRKSSEICPASFHIPSKCKFHEMLVQIYFTVQNEPSRLKNEIWFDCSLTPLVFLLIMFQWFHMVLVNIGSGNGLLPDATKPLPWKNVDSSVITSSEIMPMFFQRKCFWNHNNLFENCIWVKCKVMSK